jgi:hypothetical protein
MAGDFAAVCGEVLGTAAGRFTDARHSKIPLTQNFIKFKYAISRAAVPSPAEYLGNCLLDAMLREFDVESMPLLAF